MSVMSELMVSVVGGVLTALIVGMFTRSPPRTVQVMAPPERRRRRSMFGGFVRLVVALVGGAAVVLIGGRLLAQSGMLSDRFDRPSWTDSASSRNRNWWPAQDDGRRRPFRRDRYN